MLEKERSLGPLLQKHRPPRPVRGAATTGRKSVDKPPLGLKRCELRLRAVRRLRIKRLVSECAIFHQLTGGMNKPSAWARKEAGPKG